MQCVTRQSVVLLSHGIPGCAVQVFGASGWQQLQQQTLRRYHQRCAVTSVPASEVPLHVLPLWRFDQIRKQVQLAQLAPVCQPLLQLQQQLLSEDGLQGPEQHAAAVGLLQQVMVWEAAEVEKYLKYVQQRRQSLERDGWQLLPPEASAWLAGAAAAE